MDGNKEALEQIGKRTLLSGYRPETFTRVSEKRHGLRPDCSTNFKSYRLEQVGMIQMGMLLSLPRLSKCSGSTRMAVVGL